MIHAQQIATCWLLLIALISGCQREEEFSTTSNEISFGGISVTTLTRGIIEDGDDISSIQVCGIKNNSSSTTSVFSDNWTTLTHTDNGWDYSPKAYWEGKTKYIFAAVYPDIPDNVTIADDALTIASCSADKDLLCDVVGVDTNGSYSTKVTLSPRHILSKVTFNILNGTSDYTLKLKNLKVESACSSGNVTITTNSILWNHGNSTDDVAFSLPDDAVEVGGSIASDTQLMIPSEVDSKGNYIVDSYTVSFDAYVNDESEARHMSATMNSTLVPGKSYSFTMCVKGGGTYLEISSQAWIVENIIISNEKSQKDMNDALAVNRFAKYEAKSVDLVNHTIEFYGEGEPRQYKKYRYIAAINDSEYFSLDSLQKCGITKSTIFTGSDGCKYRIPTRNDMLLLLPGVVPIKGNLISNGGNITTIYNAGFQEEFFYDDGSSIAGFGIFNEFSNFTSSTWELYAVRFWHTKEHAVYHYEFQDLNEKAIISIKAMPQYTDIDWAKYKSDSFWNDDDVIKFELPLTSVYQVKSTVTDSNHSQRTCVYYLTLDSGYYESAYRECAFRMSTNICAVDYWPEMYERMPIRFVKVSD